MHVLVDYDNIDPRHRSRGSSHIIYRIAESLGRLAIPPPRHLVFRFYGGWFYGDKVTSSGQRVSAELQHCGVIRMRVTWGDKQTPVEMLASGTIVRSLAVMDQAPIYHTLRKRPFVGNVTFSAHIDCQNSTDCPLAPLEQFFRLKKCPSAGCEVKQESVLSRSEQKLVDTMLVSDLIYFASRANDELVAVVSSDDDMWPGIRTAMAFRQPIIQVHTWPRSTPHIFYTQRISDRTFLQTSII
jgi:hypothetical protein